MPFSPECVVTRTVEYDFDETNFDFKADVLKFLREIFPENSSFLLDAYNDATAKPYGYLIIDLTQKCHDLLRVRSNILPSDNPRNVVYIPKNAHCSASIELDGA